MHSKQCHNLLPLRLDRTGGCREAEPCVLSCISNPQQFGAAREGAAPCAPISSPSTTNLLFPLPKMNLQKFQFKVMHGKLFSNTVWKACCCVKMHV